MPPPGFVVTNRVINEPPKKVGMEELFKQFIAVKDAKTEKLEKEVGELRHGLGDMGKHMKQLETHMVQLANAIGSRHQSKIPM